MQKTRTKILLLEDNVFHRSLLAEGLEEYYEYEVSKASTLDEAKERLGQSSPDILVLDCVVGENRFEVLDWARELRKSGMASVPILFVTAYYGEMEDEVRGIEHSSILAKPFTFDDVTERMERLLGPERHAL